MSLEGGAVGWLRPDDLDPVTPVEHWVALLPLLDPTVMGWKERGFFLGAHGPTLFDTVGNAGTTAWVDGRVVGVWVQDADNVAQLRLLEEVSPVARAELDTEAQRLTEWLDGQRVSLSIPRPPCSRILVADRSAWTHAPERASLVLGLRRYAHRDVAVQGGEPAVEGRERPSA